MDELSELVTHAEDLGEADEMQVIDQLVSVAGLHVLDVGCGDGRVTRQLAARGANALGVEPDPIQAEKNRSSAAMPGLSFLKAYGQSLPLDDGVMDGVFFTYSLHHVPREHIHKALAEAMRVLKLKSGFLYVMEPLPVGSLELVFRPFHDETEERTLAYDALTGVAAPRFAEAHEFRYQERVRFDSFETFIEEAVSYTYHDFRRDRVDTSEVKKLFESGSTDDGYIFTQHTRVNLYRGLQS